MSFVQTQSTPAPKKEQETPFVVKSVTKSKVQGGPIRWSTSAGRGI